MMTQGEGLTKRRLHPEQGMTWIRRRAKVPGALIGLTLLMMLIPAIPALDAAAPYKVNAGGPAISPDWSVDTASNPSPYVNAADTGNKTFSTTQTIDMTHASIPTGTPMEVFQTERWDPDTSPEMVWDFPVTAGDHQVDLYFAEIWSGAFGVGKRVFDVSIEGVLALDDYDIYAEVGANKGVVKSFTVTADSNLDIDFDHVVQNPAIKGIAVTQVSSSAGELGADPSSLHLGDVAVGSSAQGQVTLTNLGGSGDPSITVSSTAISGTDASEFSDDFDEGTPVDLSPGESHVVTVTFAPQSSGAKSASLDISHTGINDPLAVPLSGSGIAELPGDWFAKAPSTIERHEVSYVQALGKMYLSGGRGHLTHEVYDPPSNTWGTAAALPEEFHHGQAVHMDGKIYHLGGLVGPYPDTVTPDVHIYDVGTDSWSEGTPMPTGRARGSAGAAEYNGKIYVAGGLQDDASGTGHEGVSAALFDVYDPTADTWSTLPDMPRARDHFHAAVIGDKFYAIAGREGGEEGFFDATIGPVDVFDFTTGTWSTLASASDIPTQRAGTATGVIGTEIIVIGGEGGGTAHDAVEAFDPTTESWRTLEPMPTARHGIQAAECNGGLYVVAGAMDQGGSPETTIHEAFFLDGATDCGSAPTLTHLRVNAGGPALAGTPQWSEDTTSSPSPYVNASDTGNKTYSTTSTIDMSDPSIPSGTPMELFQKERWDPPTAPEMQWDFPALTGPYEVTLYFAEIYPGAFSVGARQFDVEIEGALVLDDYDIYAEVGSDKAVAKTFAVSSDGNLDVDFFHVVENPAIKAIEIRSTSTESGVLGTTPSSLDFGVVVTGDTATKNIQLTNMGASGDPAIELTSTSMTGSDASAFTDDFSGPVTLQPGESTFVGVTFSPTVTGTHSATLEVTHDGTNSPSAIGLQGEGSDVAPVGFGKSILGGHSTFMPTTLQWGPDGRLYVGQFDGSINIYGVTRTATNSYSVTSTETITSVRDVPNHDDDGTANPEVNTRLLLGILVVGSSSNPVIYAAHSDPRIGGGSTFEDTNLDTNSGMVSRITWDGTSWDHLDLVRGLPRSEENHGPNGMQLDPATNTLYLAEGGNTNKGAPSGHFALLPETALSAAILQIDLDAIGDSTYDLPTLDDSAQEGDPDPTDPFGGNNGNNQAIIDPTGPVQIYAPGFRNAYDLVITEAGHMYAIDNGGNASWGAPPISEGPDGTCTNERNDGGDSDPDSLHQIGGAGYYGGHPNPTRGNTDNTFSEPPQSPVPSANPVECDYRDPEANPDVLTTFPSSTNGIAEYQATNFGGELQGDLLAAGYVFNIIYRVNLAADGSFISQEALFNSAGTQPLDVTTTPDEGPFPGTIWVADIGDSNIYVFEPNDFEGGGSSGCTGSDDPALDEDGDGYDNADEIDNGTDPCSSADVPPDWDGDLTSDLNDPDDDNDGLPDTSDPFALDPDNGLTTTLPIDYTWENDAPDPGGILNLGFTGLMTNGSTDYLGLYDPAKMTAGGAAGILTIDEVTNGDCYTSFNNQEYGFQFGINADPSSTPIFEISTRIIAPFSGMTPENYQSMGLFFGTGGQDDYIKLVASSNNGDGGIQFAKEVAGTFTSRPQPAVAMPGPDHVDLFLVVDPAAATVQPYYQVTTGGVTGAKTAIGDPEPFPSTWLTGTTGLAIGILSTSFGPAPTFPATWDFISVNALP